MDQIKILQYEPTPATATAISQTTVEYDPVPHALPTATTAIVQTSVDCDPVPSLVQDIFQCQLYALDDNCTVFPTTVCSLPVFFDRNSLDHSAGSGQPESSEPSTDVGNQHLHACDPFGPQQNADSSKCHCEKGSNKCSETSAYYIHFVAKKN